MHTATFTFAGDEALAERVLSTVRQMRGVAVNVEASDGICTLEVEIGPIWPAERVDQVQATIGHFAPDVARV